MPIFFDWTFILLVPALIMTIWAQSKIKKAFDTYSRVSNYRGLTGAEAARQILQSSGINNVPVERVAGNLTDHYDPRTKVVRLSESVYDSDSIAAVGVAAHEVGHAIQHNSGYFPIKVRNAIVPVVNIGSYAAIPLFIIGLLFSFPMLVTAGIYLFAGVVGFHMITLPVEINASTRALTVLRTKGILEQNEIVGARKVLTAAAMTYMAAALMAIMNLLRLILISRR
jgi:hypothetical protein